MRWTSRVVAPLAFAIPMVASAQQIDVIVVLDNSGSMDFEEQEVEQNLNTFAGDIVGSGADLHVVLISANAVCIPPPLGNPAGCNPDQNLPNYRHVVQSVGSTQLFSITLSTFPQWQPSLRAGSFRTLILITDDDDSMPVSTFMSQLVGLDPAFQDVQCHAIAATSCPPFGPCWVSGNCAETGTQYMNLVNQTGGTVSDICDQDFPAAFDAIASAIVAGSATSVDESVASESWGRVKNGYRDE